jgi:hypothetical protein
MKTRGHAASPAVSRTIVLLLAVPAVGLFGQAAIGQASQAFYCIPDVDNPPIQTFMVPQGIAELQFVVQGAHGSNPGTGAAGGFGCFVQGTFAVAPEGPFKPGQQLDVWVGCFGANSVGYGNGGDKGVANFPTAGDGGYGGGGSAIIDHATQAPLVVAGGGGGGGGSSGGTGGTGGSGGPYPQAGQDGTQGGGADGGCVNCQDSDEINGLDGEGGDFSGGEGAGGGGGGGGGAGSSYVDVRAGYVTQTTSQLAQSGTVAFSWNGPFSDADGDGVADALDRCRESDLRPTIVLGRCDSRAGNDLDVDGCTITDRVAAIAAGAGTREQFVRQVVKLWHGLRDRQSLTRAEGKAIYRCAIQVGIAKLYR